MANPQSVERVSSPLDKALAEAKSIARVQLEAAVEAQTGRLEQILDERLTELHARIDEHYRRRADRFAGLNQSARRLRQFENEQQWSRTLVDATEGLCDRAVLFAVNRDFLEPRAARNVGEPLPGPIPVASAPALAGVIETRDRVVALRSRGELSETLSRVLGEVADARASLFPILTRDRVAAILYTDGAMDSSALELLATVAGAVLDGTERKSTNILTIRPPSEPAERQTTWTSLTKDEQELHLRAQRFARVQVADMRLYKAHAVKNGRVKADLYTYLKYEIDTGRAAFRKDFMAACPSMVDYLHLELLQSLANNNATLLGKDYPGPLVA